MIKRFALGLAALALTLVGLYCFTLGGAFVFVGVALYVGLWVVWFLMRQRG